MMDVGQIRALMSDVPDNFPVSVRINQPIEITPKAVEQIRDSDLQIQYAKTDKYYDISDFRLFPEELVFYTRRLS